MPINIGIGTATQQKHTDGQAADVKVSTKGTIRKPQVQIGVAAKSVPC